MPRRKRPKRRTRARAIAAEPDDPDANVWGRAAPDLDDLPPLPPMPTLPTEEPSAPPESLVALGAPPTTAREAQAWGFRALMLQAHDAAMDVKLTSTARRKEVRVILAAAAKLYPDAARAEVATTIDEDRKQLDGRKRAKAKAELEARPPAGAAKVIPIRRDG